MYIVCTAACQKAPVYIVEATLNSEKIKPVALSEGINQSNQPVENSIEYFFKFSSNLLETF